MSFITANEKEKKKGKKRKWIKYVFQLIKCRVSFTYLLVGNLFQKRDVCGIYGLLFWKWNAKLRKRFKKMWILVCRMWQHLLEEKRILRLSVISWHSECHALIGSLLESIAVFQKYRSNKKNLVDKTQLLWSDGRLLKLGFLLSWLSC